MALTRIRAQQISNIDYKQSVRVVTTTDITLTGGAPNTVDGVSLVINNRILVTGQTTGSQNGLYYVTTVGTGSNGTWTRSSDADATGEIDAGMIVMVTEGTVYADTQWKLTTNDPITIGSTALTFVQNYLANSISAGTSNVTVGSSANVTISSAGTANVFTVSSTGTVVSGTESVTGNITGGNIRTAGLVSATGSITGASIVGGVITGTSTSVTGTTTAASVVGGVITGTSTSVTGTTTAASVVGGVITGSSVSVTGAVTGASVVGGIITGTSTSVTGTTTAASVVGGVITGSSVSVTGAVTGASLVGTITTAAQTNITSLGTLTSLSVSGNVQGGNLRTAGSVSATGAITGASVVGGVITGTSTSVTGTTTAASVVGGVMTGTSVSVTGAVTGASVVGGVITGTSTSVTGTTTAASVVGGVITGTSTSVTGTTTAASVVGGVMTGSSTSVTGNVTGANLVVATNIYDASTMTVVTGAGDIQLQPAGNVVVNNKNINNLAQPVQNQDAATKLYVDNAVSTAISYHQPVTAATTTTLATTTGGTVTYSQPNGVANGVGAKLTTTGSFNLVDTANVQTVGIRILVKNEGNAVFNGVYTWANTTNIVRATDSDTYGAGNTSALGINDYFFVSSGNVNLGSAYIVSAPTGTITFGTSNIAFAQFSQSQSYTANASAGISLAGTVINAKVDGVTTAFDGNGNISVKPSAALTTPNIGAATGTSLSVTGAVTAASVVGGVITGSSVSVTGTTTAASVVGGVITGTSTSVTGNITGGNLITGGSITATGIATSTGVILTPWNLGATNIATVGGGATASGRTLLGWNRSGGSGEFDIIVNRNGGSTGGLSLYEWANTLTDTTTLVFNVTAAGAASATGNITGANLNTAGLVSATGNIQGGNLCTAGLVSATGSITGASVVGGVMTGSSVSVTGAVTGASTVGGIITGTSTSVTGTTTAASVVGGVITGSSVSVTGTTTAASVVGGVITGTSTSVTGTTTAASVVGGVMTGSSVSVTGAVTGASLVGTIITAAQTNITSVGTLSSLSVSGNVQAGNISTSTAVISANTSTDALRITQTGAGNALLVEDSANPDSSPFVVDANGSVGIGELSPSTYVTGGLVVKNAASFTPAVMVWNKTNDASSPLFTGRKDRNGAIVQSGDELCRIFAAGYDGASYIPAASIIAQVDGTPGTNDMPGRLVFSTTADGASSTTERMRIDNAGRVGIGASTVASIFVNIGYTLTGATSVVNVRAIPTIASDVTSSAAIFRTQPFTQAAAFTLGALTHFDATLGSIGATSAIANQYGFNASASLIGATNNYGFFGNIASGANRFNFYAAGTAANVFAGTTSIGGLVGAESLRVTPTTSAVNYLNVQGSVTGGGPIIFSEGSDTNIALLLSSKGTGQNLFYTNNFGQLQFAISHTASAVNYLRASGAVTTASPSLSALGSDTNIDLALTPKGTGGVAIGATSASGYKLYVNGSFAATTKSFVIDHPTRPNMKLRYGSLEGPENGVYVRGRLKDSNTIELPDYWPGLVDPDSITVQLTPVGQHQKLYVADIVDNKVTVKSENLLNKSINCFYIIFAERKDVEKLIVEINNTKENLT